MIQACRVLEVKVVVGGGIVMEELAYDKHLLDGRLERVDELTCGDQAGVVSRMLSLSSMPFSLPGL